MCVTGWQHVDIMTTHSHSSELRKLKRRAGIAEQAVIIKKELLDELGLEEVFEKLGVYIVCCCWLFEMWLKQLYTH